jgi:hypothetical protein
VDEPTILEGLNRHYEEEQSVDRVRIIFYTSGSSALVYPSRKLTIGDAERLDVCSSDRGEGATG